LARPPSRPPPLPPLRTARVWSRDPRKRMGGRDGGRVGGRMGGRERGRTGGGEGGRMHAGKCDDRWKSALGIADCIGST
jgi:hypothetical protein